MLVRACEFADFDRGTHIVSWFKLLLWASVVATLVHADSSLNHSTKFNDKRAMRSTRTMRAKLPTRAMNTSDKIDMADIDFTEDFGVRKVNEVKDKDLSFMVAKYRISTVYLQKDITLYKKELPFTRIREMIGNVRVGLMDMSVDDYDFSNMEGISGFSSNWASKAKQNILKCGEIGGRVISVEEILSENLILEKTFVTSDKFVVHDYRLSCYLSGVELNGIACVRHMSITASKGL